MDRAVIQPDAALVRQRSDYQRLNASFETALAFRFGRGVGLCAEMLGLIKSMMSCLHSRTRLCMSRGARPAGIGIVNGLSDYFEPIFPEVNAGIFNILNMPTIPGSGRFPIARRTVAQVLRTVTGSDFFMMDDRGVLPARLVVPELGLDAEYWEACALLVRLVWTYRPEVGREVMEMVSDWNLPDSYVSVHLRRGDKSSESPYVPVDRYVTTIDSARPQGCAVVVASDDANAVSELVELLPSQFQVVPCSASSNRGYAQERFNRLPPTERFCQVKRFLAELQVLCGGDVFVGSAGSNVTYLIEMMRAGQGVLRVDTG